MTSFFVFHLLLVLLLPGCHSEWSPLEIWKSLQDNTTNWGSICGNNTLGLVQCSSSPPYVTVIQFNDQQLNGSIPDSLCGYTAGRQTDREGTLTSLTHLDLGYNNLTGSIPKCIGDLTSLRLIYLYTNHLEGEIPETICKLAKLTNLSFGTNNLTGKIPPCIDSLSQLVEFHLDQNHLNGTIPETIYNLAGLQDLQLQINNLSGIIPNGIYNLSNLNTLSLYSNRLTGQINDFICHLKSLVRLNLGSNRDGSIPNCIGDLIALTELHLDNNELTGPIPSLQKLTNLTDLDLEVTHLNSTAQFLCVSVKRFRSIADVNEGPLLKLKIVQLGGIGLTGEFPSCIKRFNLTHLDLSNNFLTGNIPEELLNQAFLETVILNNNRLSGSIVGRDQNLLPLKSLRLTANNLTSIGLIQVISCNLSGNPLLCFPNTYVSADCAGTIDRQCESIQIDAMYNNGVMLSTDRAKTVRSMSAVLLALSRNTTSFDYMNRGVSIKLQGLRDSLQPFYSNISDSVYVSLPSNVTTSQRVSVALSSISFNPFLLTSNDTIYSPVVGVSLYENGTELEIRNTERYINISMGIVDMIPPNHIGVCQFWNDSKSGWSREGCNLIVDEKNFTICQSRHLTNFSIGIVEVEPSPIVEPGGLSRTNLIIIVACGAGGLLLIIVMSLIIARGHHQRRRKHTDVILNSQIQTEVRFDEKISEGKGRQVWRCTYRETTTVAVKRGMEGSDIERECDVLRRLHHPSLIQYLGCNLRERYVVMEWMEGGSLDKYLYVHSNLSQQTIFAIAKGVSQGLSYISSLGMVHTSIIPKKTQRYVVSADIHKAPEILREGLYRSSGHVYGIGVLLWSMSTNNHHVYNGDGPIDLRQVTNEQVSMLVQQCMDARVENRPSLSQVTNTVMSQEEKKTMRSQPQGLGNVYVQA
ncbi:hypothetical protein PROFUN_12426 [Planoprotostelium fungivorum]|uniref:LRR receptor-like serine/threonine-protein kinase n=1 Tax=Planoprotostelium fungivorum TaxID=1890364 RepID=A0A2P6N5Q2_9EUKA|nr:hypothetical protein PROFUN_12426 [Planoprotostelium fungivorum]